VEHQIGGIEAEFGVRSLQKPRLQVNFHACQDRPSPWQSVHLKQKVFSEEVVRRFLQTFRFPPMASDCESSDVWMSTTSSKKFAPGRELFGVNFSARSCIDVGVCVTDVPTGK